MEVRIARLLRICCLLALLPAPALSLSGQSIPAVGSGGSGPYLAPHLTVELVSAGPAIAQGGTQTVGLTMALESTWSVAWLNPGHMGQPPRAVWTLPEGLSAGPLQFPAPSRVLLNDDAVSYGYSESVTFPVAITASASARPGPAHLAVTLSWLVCNDACSPGEANLGIDLTVVPAGTPVSAGGANIGALGAALHALPQRPPEEFALSAVRSNDDIALVAHTGTSETDAEFYPLQPDEIVDGPQSADSLDDGAVLHMKRAHGFGEPAFLYGILKLSAQESFVVSLRLVPGAIPPPRTWWQANGTMVAVAVSVLVVFVASLLWNRTRRRR